MIQIDGSQGEGGGQILRSSLALSMLTGTPFQIREIRAGRPKPGLMRQHLTCVNAAAQICGAEVSGASVGSRELTFSPGAVRAGEYHFPIGTAGGTTLVLQAVLPALLRAGGPSTVTVEGGTHNVHAPPFEFFQRALVPLINRAGARITARLERHGFYPAGGGRVVVEIDAAPAPAALQLTERGQRVSIRAIALVARLSRLIAERELTVLRSRLGLAEDECEIVQSSESLGPGNAMWVELRYENVTEVFSAVGSVGTSAEAVARQVADETREYVASQRPVGVHMADQLMLPLAALGGGCYSAAPLSQHASTNIAVLRLFGANVTHDADGLVRVDALTPQVQVVRGV